MPKPTLNDMVVREILRKAADRQATLRETDLGKRKLSPFGFKSLEINHVCGPRIPVAFNCDGPASPGQFDRRIGRIALSRSERITDTIWLYRGECDNCGHRFRCCVDESDIDRAGGAE